MADYISINGKESKYGIKLSGKSEKVIEEIRKHTNEKGFFNFELLKRKEAGKYGETHYVKVDTWQPTPKEETATQHKQYPAKEEESFRVPDSDGDNLPF